ncbi:MAG: hypothetical protein R2716_02060 [Microthrixaceae bacterium]
MRRAIEIGSLCWAVLGAAVAVASLPAVNGDARMGVGVASVLFPLCAVGAAVALAKGHARSAGVLLVASAATPTYFAYFLNLPALLVGVLLVAVPAVVQARR